MAYSYEQLRTLSKEQLVGEYDKHASSTSTGNEGINFWRQEIMLRATEEQTEAMLKLTTKILYLTRVIAGLTVVMLLGLGIQIWLAIK